MTTINPAVGASANDAKWGLFYGGADYANDSADLWVGNRINGVRDDFSIALRFTNVTIPQGATIDAAYVTLRGGETDSTSGLIASIWAADADNQAMPADYDACEALTRTTATVSWTDPAVTSGSNINTPSIATVIKEVVDRAGWASGNALVVCIENNQSTNGVYRSFHSYDSNSSYAPVLHVEYTEASSGVSGTLSVTLGAATVSASGEVKPVHTFDTNARLPGATGTSTTNPLTGTYTCGTGTTVLAVMLNFAGTARGGGAPTYAGGTLLQAGTTRYGTTGPEASAELWYLLDPPTGTAGTVSIPNSGGVAMAAMVASAIAGAGYTSALEATGGSARVSTNPIASITTSTVGDIIFGVVSNGATTFNPTATTGVQLYENDNGSWGGGAQYLIKTNTGAQDIAWTFGTSEDWGIALAAFKPTVATNQGVVAQTLAALTLSAAGTSNIAGALTKTLAALTSNATGTIAVNGSTTATLGALTLGASGTIAVTGAAAGTLGAVTVASAGAIAVTGSASSTLGALSLSAAGVVSDMPVISGALSATLGAVTLSADGSITDAPIYGAVTSTLGALTGSAAGKVAITGSANVTLTGATLTGTGAAAISGQAAQTLDGLTIQAAGAVAINGGASVTLTGLTLAATIFTGALPYATSMNAICKRGSLLCAHCRKIASATVTT